MKIQTSMLISQMAGSLNGSTVRRSRYGLVLQNKASGLQRNTTALGVRRNIFAFLAHQWTVLATNHKQQWQDISNENPQTDKFGNPIILSGYAYYLKIQNVMLTANYNPITADDYDNKVDTINSLTVKQLTATHFEPDADLSGVNHTERVVFFAVKVPTGSESPFLNYKQFVTFFNVSSPKVIGATHITTALQPISKQWYIGAFVVTDRGGISPTVLAKADW